MEVSTTRRWALPAGVAAAVVLAAALAFVLLRGSGGGGLSTVSPNSVGVVDPGSNDLVTEIPVGIDPESVTVGEGAVWVANVVDETVTRIDPATRERGRTIDVGDYPSDVIVAAGTVWVALGALAELTRIDPTQDQAATPIPALGPGVSCGAPRASLAAGDGAVWFACQAADLGRIDIQTGTARRVGLEAGLLTSPNAVLPEFSDIVYGLGSLWIVNRAANVVTEVDTATIQRQRDITVGNSPTAIAVSPPDSLWVANFEDDTVTRIVIPGRGADADPHPDPRRGRARRRHLRRRQRLGRLEPRSDAHPDRPGVGRRAGDDRGSGTSRSASRPARAACG